MADRMLSNAARFARHEIRIEVTEADGTVGIAVADDGPGLPESFLGNAFDRFTRADSARRRHGAGAGLGLAIVAALTEAQHGTVRARNGPPLGGAVVEIELPAAGSADH